MHERGFEPFLRLKRFSRMQFSNVFLAGPFTNDTHTHTEASEYFIKIVPSLIALDQVLKGTLAFTFNRNALCCGTFDGSK